QRVDRFLVAVDDVEHAFRQASLEKEFSDPQRPRRVAFGRFENERVATSDRWSAFPQRNHRREIKRGDAGDNAERLGHRDKINAAPGALAEFTLHQVWNPAGELQDLEAALDVALGIREGLAVLGGQQAGQIVVLALDQFQELEHYAGAALGIGRGPGREGSFRISDRLLRLGLTG